MSSNDWSNLGNDIRDIVQNAVETKDFNKLNQTISTTIAGAVDGAGEALKKAGLTQDPLGRQKTSDRVGSGNGAHRASDRVGQPVGAAARTFGGRDNGPKYFASVSGPAAGGLVMAVVCGVAALFFGGTAFLMLIGILAFGDWGAAGAVLFFLIFFVILAVLAWRGWQLYQRTRRFQMYVRALGGRTYAEVRDLAAKTRKSADFVRKDLSYMVEKKWFLEGHLGERKTSLMVTDEVYREYQDALARTKELKRQQEAAKKAAEARGLTPEVRAAIEEGEAYVRRIRESNDAIPGEEISAKISRMETIVQRIFERIEQHPENLPDIRRLMDYYLPTTMKLLGAYEELDRQPIQGENIVSSKKEIEDSLDTLNLAFENLLDGLFKDTAWDVSTDISVLHTMLKQEGLTGNEDFKKANGQE